MLPAASKSKRPPLEEREPLRRGRVNKGGVGVGWPRPQPCGGYYLQPQGDSQHRRREQSRSHRLGRQLLSQPLVQLEQEELPQPLVQLEQEELPQPLVQLEQEELPQPLVQLEQEELPQPLVQLEQPLLLLAPQPHGSTGTKWSRLTQISSGTVTFTRLQTVVGTHSVVVTGTFTQTV